MLWERLIPHFSWQELLRDSLGFWRSTTFRIAALCLAIGVASWLSGSKKSSPSPTSTLPSAAASTSTSNPNPKLEPESPALLRFGGGYIGGFLIGFAFRKFIKLTTMLAAAALAALATLKGLGWIELDWASIEGHIRESLGWLHGQAEAFKIFLTGYLPSAGASGWGMFRGIRWKG